LLKVSFFKPFYGDYKIVYVDENYTNMLVTSSTYNYLWLLSRNKYLLYDREQLVNLLIIASNLGFDTTKMIIPEFEK
jgi:apolipoprotein D and lipocalin family protein